MEGIAPVVKKQGSNTSLVKDSANNHKKDFKTCVDIAKEIVITSPRFIQLTKGLTSAVIDNGGQSFGVSLEGSPNPKKDKALSFSKTYDFTVYEIYTDRQLNAGSFSFNPVNNQLYEYNQVADKLQPIVFDRDLLMAFGLLCK
jgi:hypothetical protein